MRNKLIFLIQYIQGCGDFEMVGNSRCRKTGVVPTCPQSLAGFSCVNLIRLKLIIFPHLRYEGRLLFRGVEAARIVRIDANVFFGARRRIIL